MVTQWVILMVNQNGQRINNRSDEHRIVYAALIQTNKTFSFQFVPLTFCFFIVLPHVTPTQKTDDIRRQTREFLFDFVRFFLSIYKISSTCSCSFHYVRNTKRTVNDLSATFTSKYQRIQQVKMLLRLKFLQRRFLQQKQHEINCK